MQENLRIIYFGRLTEIAETADESFQVEENLSVEILESILHNRYEGFQNESYLLFLNNNKITDRKIKLKPDDELCFMPVFWEDNFTPVMVSFELIEGPIGNDIIKTETHSAFNTGATAVYLGRVRSDSVGNKSVTSIEFTTHATIAAESCSKLMKNVEQQYKLNSIKIIHSLGNINAGDTCFAVIVDSVHRIEAFEALSNLVNEFKKQVPVFGKEYFNDGSYAWKQNKF